MFKFLILFLLMANQAYAQAGFKQYGCTSMKNQSVTIMHHAGATFLTKDGSVQKAFPGSEFVVMEMNEKKQTCLAYLKNADSELDYTVFSCTYHTYYGN